MTRTTESCLAWFGLGIVVVILLFAPILSARGSGGRELIVHVEGDPTNEAAIRVAGIMQKHAESLLTDPPHPEVKWQNVDDETKQIELRLTHSTVTKSSFLLDYGTTRMPYEDALAVEYRTSSEEPRFRLVSLQDLPKTGAIELTISREPPTEAEVWRPNQSMKSRGR